MPKFFSIWLARNTNWLDWNKRREEREKMNYGSRIAKIGGQRRERKNKLWLQGQVFQAKPKMHRTLSQWVRYNEFVESGPKSQALVHGQRLSRCSSRTEFSRGDCSSARSGELFLVPLVWWGISAPPFYFSLLPFYSSFLPPEWVLRVGTCSINPSLQLLGVVVKAEKHGYVRYMALNAVMTAFPSNISIFSAVIFYFSTFPVPWNDLECHC